MTSSPPADSVLLHTLYAPTVGSLESGTRVALEDDQRRHVRSLRLAAGDEVRLTDARGSLWIARLDEVEGSRTTCTLLRSAEAPSTVPIDLAFGVAGKHRTLWLVEKAVELGVQRLQPVDLERSRSVADAARSPAFWAKARRRAMSALVQSGGAVLPWLAEPVSLVEYLDGAHGGAAGEADDGAVAPARRDGSQHGGARRPTQARGPRVLLEQSGETTVADALSGWRGAAAASLLIGGEGGLTQGERRACRDAGFASATIGPRTLRFETAAVAALAIASQCLFRARASARRPTRPGVDPTGR